MEHTVTAPTAGIVAKVFVVVGPPGPPSTSGLPPWSSRRETRERGLIEGRHELDLSEDARGVPQGGAGLRRARRSPRTWRTGTGAPFPVETVRAMGDLGLFGLVFPEEWGGGGGDFASLCIAIEEIGRVDQSMGITLSAGVGLGANPIYRFGNESRSAMAARPRRRPGTRRVRPHRARRRQRRRRHPHPGRARRRRVGDRRGQGVHHELGTPDHVRHHGDGAHRRRDLGVRRRAGSPA